MIWLSRKAVFRRVVLTLNARNLEFVGNFKFFTREKKIVKLYEAEIPQFCLYLSTETGEYGSTVIVSKEKYNQARLKEFYGLCGVIRNIRHDDLILITENTDPDTAIWQVVKKSWRNMIFILIVLGLCLWTILFFARALLHLSLNWQ